MTPNEYVKNATVTESRIESINFSHPTQNFFDDLVDAMIALGAVLDQFKKNAFYNKPFNIDKIKELIGTALYDVKNLQDDLINDNFPKDAPDFQRAVNPRYFHSIVGIATEAIELLEILNVNCNTVDTVNLLEEFGDLNWYQAIGIDEAGGDFEQVLERNIAKLKARYPNKFSSENAINRNLEKERSILEGNSQEP